MKTPKISIYLFPILLLFSFTHVEAQKMNFQGKIFSNGNPINTPGNFTFLINELGFNWSENHNNVPIINGLYNIILGEGSPAQPIPLHLFRDSPSRRMIVSYNGTPIDTVTLYAPFERDYTVIESVKDGISWQEVTNKPTIDTSFTNELQTLSINGNTLSISEGNSVVLPSQQQIGNLFVNGSVTVIDTSQSQMISIPFAGFSTCNSNSGSPVWQSFTATANGKIRRIVLNLGVSQGSSVRVRFYNGQGNGTTSIAQKDFSGIGNILTSHTLDFSQGIFPVQIISGNIYTFEISAVTPNASVAVNCSNANPYAGGRADLGVSTDYAFQIFIDNSQPPVFATAENGYIGIGTSEPQAQLQVNGRIMDKTGFIMPVGTVISFAGPSANLPGWLECNGNIISRIQYAELFQAIGTAWGIGDGSTTFHLPDLQGQFLRGLNGIGGADPNSTASSNNGADGRRYAKNQGGNTGNNVGSYQNDALKSHNHNFHRRSGVSSGQNVTAMTDVNLNNTSASPRTDDFGGLETRPVNAYVRYFIKH